MTDSLQFLEVVRPRQQVFAALEGFALKIRTQTIGQYRNIQLVGYITKLEHLIAGQKLCFINQYTVKRCVVMQRFDNLIQIVGALEYCRFRLNSNTRCHLARTVTIIEQWRHDKRIHAAFFVVITGLQKRSRFTRVHRRIIEIKFSHRCIVASL